SKVNLWGLIYRLPFDKGNRWKGRFFNNPPSVARGGNPKDWVNSGYAITPCLSFRKTKNKAELNLSLNK
ncbi:TPA: hypothetical protein ACHOXM_005066, partial [Escherichia coli]